MSDITDEQIDRVLFRVFDFIDRSEVWGIARDEPESLRQAVRLGLADKSDKSSNAWEYDGISSLGGVTVRFEVLDGVWRATLEGVSDVGQSREQAKQRLRDKILRCL